MLKKDDEDWLAILSGKNVPNADQNTVREALVFREALQAEKRLQQIMAKLEANGYMKPENVIVKTEKTQKELSFTTLFAKMDSWFFAKIPSFANVLLVSAILGIIAGVHLLKDILQPDEPAPASIPKATEDSDEPTQQLIPKSSQDSPQSQPNFSLPSSGPAQISYFDENPELVAKDLENEFISAGAKVKTSQLADKFQVDITIPDTPSDELRELCDEYDINLKEIMSSTHLIRFIVSPE
ncbi:MAG TPA: hypothetical protein EYP59_05200 [Thiotrichaceae bacterium]|nr:hypothetical protein [Thiotrichaceae bacterium]